MKKIIVFIVLIVGLYGYISKKFIDSFEGFYQNYDKKIQEVAKTLDFKN